MELIQSKSKNSILKCIWFLFLFLEIKGIACITAEQDLTLTIAEKKALDQVYDYISKIKIFYTLIIFPVENSSDKRPAK
jgi:hypothetical protein